MKKQPVLFPFFVLILFAFNGCTSHEHNNSFDIEKVKAFIKTEYPVKFSQAFANGDAAGVIALYTSNGMMMPPNEASATGTEQMIALLNGFLQSGAKGITLTPVEIMGGADGILVRGDYELYGENNSVIDNGKYCEFWIEENGTWKVHRDIWNSNNPPQPPPTSEEPS